MLYTSVQLVLRAVHYNFNIGILPEVHLFLYTCCYLATPFWPFTVVTDDMKLHLLFYIEPGIDLLVWCMFGGEEEGGKPYIWFK